MSENNNDMFLYTVKPRKVIIGLSGSTKVLRTNKSVYLSKEDVYLCLKNATVYRRFANEGFNERVTIDDVERVHRENYISPEDWKKFISEEKSINHGNVVVTEESYKEEEISEPIQEENKESEHSEFTNEIVETEKVVYTEEKDITTEIQNDKDDVEVESDDDEIIEKIETAEKK